MMLGWFLLLVASSYATWVAAKAGAMLATLSAYGVAWACLWVLLGLLRERASRR